MDLQHILNTFRTRRSKIFAADFFQVARKKYRKRERHSKETLSPLLRPSTYIQTTILYSEGVNITSENGEFLRPPCIIPVTNCVCAIMTTFSAGQSLSGLISLSNVRKTRQWVCFLKRYMLSYIHLNKLHDFQNLEIVDDIFCGFVHFWPKVRGCRLMRHSSHLILLKIAQNCSDGR